MKDLLCQLEATHKHALLSLGYVLSYRRKPVEIGKGYLSFDATALATAVNTGRKAIKPVVDRLLLPTISGAVKLPTGGWGVSCCGIRAKCNHGLCLELGAALLRRLASKPPKSNPFDADELFGLYAMVGAEHTRAIELLEKPAAQVKWSKQDTPGRWARKFGWRCAKTFIRHVKSGKIRVNKLNDKSYQVDIDALPANQK